MEYSRWTEMQPPNPNPTQMNPYSHYTTRYSSYNSHLHPQNPNPNPNPNFHIPVDPHKYHEPHYGGAGLDTDLKPPGIDSYLSVSSYSLAHVSGYAAHQQSGVVYAHQQVVDSATVVPSAYYRDPRAVAAVQNWAVEEAVKQFGGNAYGLTIPPNGTEQLVAANPNSTLWINPTNPTTRPRGNSTWKRGPKKTKVIQSAWCEICKVDCNSKDVLGQHKLGKKHQKNLEKLKKAITLALAPAPAPATATATSVSDNPVIGPEENPDKGKLTGGRKKKKKAAESMEDLETKRRKILEGGAAVDAVRTCAICNVVCNSELVFTSHLAGQKHAAMMKKHASGTGVATIS